MAEKRAAPSFWNVAQWPPGEDCGTLLWFSIDALQRRLACVQLSVTFASLLQSSLIFSGACVARPSFFFFCTDSKEQVVRTTEPIKRLRGVSLCAQANIWAPEKEVDRRAVATCLPPPLPAPPPEPRPPTPAEDGSVSEPGLAFSLTLLNFLIAPPSVFVLFAFECRSHWPPFTLIFDHRVLPADCCVYSSSRSPPVEDGDASRRRARLRAAVGITAATSSKLAGEKQEGREGGRGSRRVVKCKMCCFSLVINNIILSLKLLVALHMTDP